jgi:hypothetical protein
MSGSATGSRRPSNRLQRPGARRRADRRRPIRRGGRHPPTEGFDVSDDNLARFVPLLARAKVGAVADLKRAANGDYSEEEKLAKLPVLTRPAIDIVKAFEEYSSKGGLKGGAHGATAKRWRPKIKAFVKWFGHCGLSQMATADGYRWADHLVEEGYARKSVRDVWIAALSATAASWSSAGSWRRSRCSGSRSATSST